MTGRSGDERPDRFVYGLRVGGLDDVTELSDPIDNPAGGIAVQVAQSTGPAPAPHQLDAQRNTRVLATGHVLDLDRQRGRATFFGPPISPDQLAHPYLGPVAVTVNRWAGREVFHAAAFVNGGRAWVLIGPRTAGKSTLVAALAASGVTILADDIVVTDGSTVFAGPRCIDLRQPIPEFLPTASYPPSQPARLGTRTRIALPRTASNWPLGGWFFLRWSDTPGIKEVSIVSLLQRLTMSRCAPALPSDPSRSLSLAGHPGWELHRRKAWSQLLPTVDTLLATTSREIATAPTPQGRLPRRSGARL
jgi:hypothetical protein